MKTINAYLDQAKKRHNLPSDYALAQKLGVRSSQITNYRRGTSRPDEMMSVKLARLLAINPLEIIASANYHRAVRSADSAAKKFWMQVYKEVK